MSEAGATAVENGAVPNDVRRRLALALDLDDLVEAHRLAAGLRPWFGVVKIGLELYSAAGPDAVGALRDLGYQVFLDLKLYDIPTTVNRATQVLGALGVEYLTLHALGGVDMLRAGVEGLVEGASGADLDPPVALAVTVLTSDGSAPAHIVPNRVRQAVEGGCGGLVLAAADLQTARELAPRLKRVVPGIRLPGADRHDQARSATPQEAAANGADLLVIGRTVTEADDPRAATGRGRRRAVTASSTVDTASERADALEWAELVRRAREDTRSRLQHGAMTLEEVFDSATRDDVVGHQRLLWVLESLPGASKVATRRELSGLGIDPDQPVGRVDEADRAVIMSRFPLA